MAYKLIPAKRQRPGQLMGSIWCMLQAWPYSNLYSIAMLGPQGGRITDGYGDWSATERPKDVSIIEWQGRKPYAMSLDLMWDGWLQHPVYPGLSNRPVTSPPKLPRGWSFVHRQGLWVENHIGKLEELALPRNDTDEPPPSLRIYGAVPHAELRWVIQGLDWGDCIRDEVTGRRMRQQVTVSLLEYTYLGDPIRRIGRTKGQTKKKKPAPKKAQPKKK